MKYKVGDKVKIVREGNNFDSYGEMRKFIGKTMVVSDVFDGVDGKYCYTMDDNCCVWRDDCMELAEKQFTKADLKPCMVVELRNKKLWLVGQNINGICLAYLDGLQGLYENEFNNDLTCKRGCLNDIVKIYGFNKYSSTCYESKTDGRELLWERIEKTPTQLKLEELENKQREIADEIKKVREGM